MEKNIDSFNRDAKSTGGYLYTTCERLSSRLSNRRISRAVGDAQDFRGKRVLDLGCGDGTYTLELRPFSPAFVMGLDPAEEAIARCTVQHGDPMTRRKTR